MPEKYRGETIGFWPFKSDWYSICSRHRVTDKSCNMCMAGRYVGRISGGIGHLFHSHAYPIWYWWVNRKNSKSRKHLESIFPGLKGKPDETADHRGD